MAEITLNAKNFEAEVLDASGPVLVDFWATWCAPCRMLAPVLAAVAKERDGKVKVGKVNVDDEPDLATQYGIMNIPTVLLFENGRLVDTLVGFHPKEELDVFLSDR